MSAEALQRWEKARFDQPTPVLFISAVVEACFLLPLPSLVFYEAKKKTTNMEWYMGGSTLPAGRPPGGGLPRGVPGCSGVALGRPQGHEGARQPLRGLESGGGGADDTRVLPPTTPTLTLTLTPTLTQP